MDYFEKETGLQHMFQISLCDMNYTGIILNLFFYTILTLFQKFLYKFPKLASQINAYLTYIIKKISKHHNIYLLFRPSTAPAAAGSEFKLLISVFLK
jgi:hypothetical protein